jgi:hypothetical protein
MVSYTDKISPQLTITIRALAPAATATNIEKYRCDFHDNLDCPERFDWLTLIEKTMAREAR